MGMADPHCSKCCPVKPPAPPEPFVAPFGMYLWGAVGIAGVVGAWWAVAWLGSSLWR
jgi:hypothetical protein